MHMELKKEIYIYIAKLDHNALQKTQILSRVIKTDGRGPLYLLGHKVCLSKESNSGIPQEKHESS